MRRRKKGQAPWGIGGHVKHICIYPGHNEEPFKYFTQTGDVNSCTFLYDHSGTSVENTLEGSGWESGEGALYGPGERQP